MEAASPPQPSTSLPPFTRTLTLLLIILAIFSHIPPFATPLTATVSLIPASTIARSKPWNILSAGFVELDVARAFLNVPLLLVLARCIEASWGPRMMAVYILAVNFLAGFIAYISMLVAYAATHIDSFLFAPIGTINGISVALLIAVKQLIPEHEVGISLVNISTNYLPLLYLSLISLLTLLQLSSLGVLIFTLAAFQFSWLYLRFFQTRNNMRGDPSDAFAYSTLFPPPISPFVLVCANITFTIFKPLLLSSQNANTDNTNPAPQDPISKAASVDAERRRQRALKALDERLNTSSTLEQNPSDSPV